MCMHRLISFCLFSLVNLSWVSLICRAPAEEPRRAERKRILFLPYTQIRQPSSQLSHIQEHSPWIRNWTMTEDTHGVRQGALGELTIQQRRQMRKPAVNKSFQSPPNPHSTHIHTQKMLSFSAHWSLPGPWRSMQLSQTVPELWGFSLGGRKGKDLRRGSAYEERPDRCTNKWRQGEEQARGRRERCSR